MLYLILYIILLDFCQTYQNLKYFAKLFDMKWTTLKAYADTFDWFIPTTNRVGLKKTNIEPIMKEVLDEYEKQDEKNSNNRSK